MCDVLCNILKYQTSALSCNYYYFVWEVISSDYLVTVEHTLDILLRNDLTILWTTISPSNHPQYSEPIETEHLCNHLCWYKLMPYKVLHLLQQHLPVEPSVHDGYLTLFSYHQ